MSRVKIAEFAVRPMRADEILTARTDLCDAAAADAEPVSTVRTVLLVRGGVPAAAPAAVGA